MKFSLDRAHQCKPGTEDAFKAASLANAQNSVQEDGIARFDCIQSQVCARMGSRKHACKCMRVSRVPARVNAPAHANTHTRTRARTHAQFQNVYLFIHSFIHPSIHPSMHSSMHPCIHSFIHPFIHSFIRSCIHSFIYTFIHSYIHTCIHSSSLRAGGREQIRARGSVQGRRSARQTQGNCPLCRVARRRYLHPTSTLPTPYFPPSYTLLLPFHHPTFRLPTLYFHRTYTLHSSTNCRLELAHPIRKPLLH